MRVPHLRFSRALFWLVSSVAVAHGPACAEWVERPDTMHWHRLADYDHLEGNVRVLYQTMPSLQQGGQPDASVNVYIAELYPDGRIENRRLATGQRRFSALVVRGAEALKSDIDPNIGFEVGGRRIEARVHSETRMLKINAGGNLDWVSPALEREFMWKGDVSIPDDIPMNEILQQNNAQMRLMEQTNLEYAGQRDLVHYAHHGHDEVHLTPEGYGLLADVTANRNLDPPVHGPRFIEVGEEFAQVQELSEQMQSASQAEVMSMVSNPSFQALMNCMSGCAMQYAQCR